MPAHFSADSATAKMAFLTLTLSVLLISSFTQAQNSYIPPNNEPPVPQQCYGPTVTVYDTQTEVNNILATVYETVIQEVTNTQTDTVTSVETATVEQVGTETVIATVTEVEQITTTAVETVYETSILTEVVTEVLDQTVLITQTEIRQEVNSCTEIYESPAPIISYPPSSDASLPLPSLPLLPLPSPSFPVPTPSYQSPMMNGLGAFRGYDGFKGFDFKGFNPFKGYSDGD